MNNRKVKVTVLVAITLAMASCATSRVDTYYGDAVNSTVEAQIYDPIAASSPSAEAALGTDGKRMEAVMESYRGQTGNGDSVSQPIVINVGQ